MADPGPSTNAIPLDTNTSTKKLIYIVRHGETTFNKAKLLQGQTNASVLTPIGILGAKLCGRFMKSRGIRPDALYSSCLARAKQSASAIAAVMDITSVIEEPLLNERAAGRHEGRTREEVAERIQTEPEVAAIMKDHPPGSEEYFRIVGLESWDSLRNRATRALELFAASTARVIIVVSHGRFLSTLFTRIDPSYGEMTDMSNCTITTVEYDSNAADGKRFMITHQHDGARLFNKQMVEYSTHTYPPDHWSLVLPDPSYFVCDIRLPSGFTFLVYLNPTDSRGYRTIVRLWENDPSLRPSLLNRPSTDAEDRALLLASSIVVAAWKLIGLVVQVEVLGNNAHSTCTDTKNNVASPSMVLGSSHEPLLLHSHIICRGIPTHEFVPGLPLLGPPPGEIFNLRGDSNHPLHPWSHDGAILVRDTLRDLMVVASKDGFDATCQWCDLLM